MNFISKVFNKDYSKERLQPFGDSITDLKYPNCSLVELLEKTAIKYPKLIAYDYFGKEVSYQKFLRKIEHTAKSLKELGVKKGERVTICMPNTPEAIIFFYAVNMIGATANMIHPLSSENEIEYYLEVSNSKYILAVDLLKTRILKATKNLELKQIILASVSYSMPAVIKTAYFAQQYIKKVTNKKDTEILELDESKIITWDEFDNLGYAYDKDDYKTKVDSTKEAVILYSGGTTGKPKGVLLSHNAINSMALQAISRIESAEPGKSVLSILPIFHGFGLACCVHTVLLAGMKSYLIPKF
ncbi:MAG: class I adenylate-forming enzyme family protein, partial [Bacilli bacterium]|nr:class I adenylate-forming enzyme family protein [Bacilli bacterium]